MDFAMVGYHSSLLHPSPRYNALTCAEHQSEFLGVARIAPVFVSNAVEYY